MGKQVRAHAIISGRVQGVFFRMETKHEADNHSLTGWVRNRNDGTVEALFEGDQDHVISVLAWCKTGPPRSKVSDVEVKWHDYLGEFERFDIRAST